MAVKQWWALQNMIYFASRTKEEILKLLIEKDLKNTQQVTKMQVKPWESSTSSKENGKFLKSPQIGLEQTSSSLLRKYEETRQNKLVISFLFDYI